MMDMPSERRPGEWFETSPGEDDRQDTEEFLRIILERVTGQNPRLTQVLTKVVRDGDHAGNPWVSRHGTVDLDHSQIRTYIVNVSRWTKGDRHTVVSARKVRLGMLAAKAALALALALHGQDAFSAVAQILNLVGTFDVDVAHLEPQEAALLTAAHLDSPPIDWQQWMHSANDILNRWNVKDRTIGTRQDLDAWLRGLTSRGIAVEYSGPNNDYIRIRHLVILMQW